MKTKILILISSVLFLAGCGTTNPLYTVTPNVVAGQTNGYEYAFTPGASNVIAGLHAAAGVIPGYGPVAQGGVDLLTYLFGAGFTIASGVSGLIWRSKNQHQQAADLLAATVVKTSQQQTALNAASGTSVLPVVAQHLDNNTVV